MSQNAAKFWGHVAENRKNASQSQNFEDMLQKLNLGNLQITNITCLFMLCQFSTRNTCEKSVHVRSHNHLVGQKFSLYSKLRCSAHTKDVPSLTPIKLPQAISPLTMTNMSDRDDGSKSSSNSSTCEDDSVFRELAGFSDEVHPDNVKDWHEVFYAAPTPPEP